MIWRTDLSDKMKIAAYIFPTKLSYSKTTIVLYRISMLPMFPPPFNTQRIESFVKAHRNAQQQFAVVKYK